MPPRSRSTSARTRGEARARTTAERARPLRHARSCQETFASRKFLATVRFLRGRLRDETCEAVRADDDIRLVILRSKAPGVHQDKHRQLERCVSPLSIGPAEVSCARPTDPRSTLQYMSRNGIRVRLKPAIDGARFDCLRHQLERCIFVRSHWRRSRPKPTDRGVRRPPPCAWLCASCPRSRLPSTRTPIPASQSLAARSSTRRSRMDQRFPGNSGTGVAIACVPWARLAMKLDGTAFGSGAFPEAMFR